MTTKKVQAGGSQGVNEMKLTRNDKEILKSMGVPEEDFKQIEEASKVKCTTYDLDEILITQTEAIHLLGRKAFLAGLSRSTFHWSACQVLPDGRTVGFDSGKYCRST